MSTILESMRTRKHIHIPFVEREIFRMRSFLLKISISTAVNDQIVHFYDRSLKICRITTIAEIIICRYGAKSNSILVDVMEYELRSTRTSIVKKVGN